MTVTTVCCDIIKGLALRISANNINHMNRHILEDKKWYRALKVIFVTLFACAQISGILVINTIARVNTNPVGFISDLDMQVLELAGMATPSSVKYLTEGQVRELISHTISGKSPAEVVHELVQQGYTLEGYGAQQNAVIIQKNEGGDSSAGAAYYWQKYSLIMRLLYYFFSLLFVSLFFWLLSRTFFYIVTGEAFLSPKFLKKFKH